MAGKRTYGPDEHHANDEGAVLFSIKEDASDALHRLADRFPEAIDDALRRLGGHTRKRIQAAMFAGSENEFGWPGLSEMREYRAFHRFKKGETPRNSYRGRRKKNPATGQWFSPGLIQRTKSRKNYPDLYGKLSPAIRFFKPRNKQQVSIGALTFWSSRFLSAVQEGKRGSKGAFQYAGIQRVTPAMRRALWAAGFPLSADTTVIGQEPRPLIEPVFKSMEPRIADYLLRGALDYLAANGVEGAPR